MTTVRSKNFLFGVLFLVTGGLTLLPAIVVPFVNLQLSWAQFVLLIGVIGNMHVGMTGFFFVGDARYKAMIADAPLWYVGFPLLLIAVAFFVFAVWPDGIWPYFLIHYPFLMWHFGRQNFGIYSFVAGANQSGPISQLERTYFNLLPLSILPKILTLYPNTGLSGRYTTLANALTLAMISICIGLAALIIIREKNIRRDKQRAIALLMGLAFFLPTAFSSNSAIALTFFAHPAQYVVMMIYLAGDRKQGSIVVRLGLLAATGFGLWAVLTFFHTAAMPIFLALSYGVDSGAPYRRCRPLAAATAEAAGRHSRKLRFCVRLTCCGAPLNYRCLFEYTNP